MTAEVRQAIRPLTDELRKSIEHMTIRGTIEEIRLKCGCPILVITDCEERRIDASVSQHTLELCVETACKHSVYAAQQMLRHGYVILEGGHRMGVCGMGVMKDGALSTLREISSLNLRVARQILGCASQAAGFVWTHRQSTLILGAPGRGKTTLLRDLIRILSDTFGRRVGVVDERRELAACVGGLACFDLGLRSDVLSAVPKAQAIEMLLRSMRPEWIAVDEITAEADVDAISRAAYCGVRFLATAHAQSRDELSRRSVYQKLLEARVFENVLTILPDRTILAEKMEGL